MLAQTTASSATWVTTRRARSDQVRGAHHLVPVSAPPRGSARRSKDIPRTTQRVDHRFATAVDLLAQIRDVELHDVGAAAEVIAPHPIEDLGLAQYPLGIAHHEAQQFELR